MGDDKKFDWQLHKDVDAFVKKTMDLFLSRNAYAKGIADRLMAQTSTRFVDWIDHIVLPHDYAGEKDLKRLGMTAMDVEAPEGARVFRHLDTYLFPILLKEGKGMEVSLKSESIEDFAQVLATGAKISGAPFSPLRKLIVSAQKGATLSAVERRGYDGFIVRDAKDTNAYLEILSGFFDRRRYFDTDDDGMAYTEKLISNAVKKLDSARVSDAFFRAERAYWQKRNRAGQVQKARQDRLGLGWGNHDHHTYRSSRKNFAAMIRIFERMGYSCREKYYAGETAGWGAQIMEHKVCNIVVFTDVDLRPDETRIDFAHKGLKKKEKKLGTVGLWVGLHGESMLQAGMHHLEARFEFEKLSGDLAGMGVEVMKPFSYFDFLKQAFTVGDRWPVDKRRLDALLVSGYITKDQHDDFTKNGAIGSHMENLEREQGFKGFNRASVTKIIMETDPRKQHFAGA